MNRNTGILMNILSVCGGTKLQFSPWDEPRNFYDRLTHWVKSWNTFFSEAEPFECKNQVDVLKIKRQIKSYSCLNSIKIQISLSFPWDFDNFSSSLSFPGFPGLLPPSLLAIHFMSSFIFTSTKNYWIASKNLSLITGKSKIRWQRSS